MLLRDFCVGLVLVFVVACNGGGGADGGGSGGATSKDSGPMDCSDAGPATGTSFPCDVAPIIESKCRRCHDRADALASCLADSSCLDGPFPLVTWSDTRRKFATGRVVDFLPDVIEKRIMPLVDPSVKPPVQPLTDDEQKTMLAWIRSCAPAAPAACGP